MLRADGKEGNPAEAPRERVGEVYRSESRRAFATLGRFRAIDSLRRRARFDAALAELADRLDHEVADVIGDVEIEVRQVVEISDLAPEYDRNDEGGRK